MYKTYVLVFVPTFSPSGELGGDCQRGHPAFPSADCGFVVKEPLENREWTCWCAFDEVTYPPEVYAALNPTTEDVTDEINEDLEE